MNEGINAPKTRGRPFAKGNSGRPKAARHKSTILAEQLLASDVDGVVRSVVKAAKRGNMVAAKIVLERLAPPRRSRPFWLDRFFEFQSIDRVCACSATGRIRIFVGMESAPNWKWWQEVPQVSGVRQCSAQGHNPRGQPIDAEPYTLLCWTSTRSTEARDEARLLADMRQTVQCPGSALIGADARLTSDRPEETITWKPSH